MTSAFPNTTLSSATARSFGPLPGFAGHSLHGLQTQLNESHLQSAYKTVPQGSYALSDPYVGLRLTTQAASAAALTKPLFAQDAAIAQSPTLDIAQKQWGLSNFVGSTVNPFGLLPGELPNNDILSSAAALSSQPSPAPPPAHNVKHSSALQTSYQAEDILCRNTKSPLQRSSTYEYRGSSSSGQPNYLAQSNPLLAFNQDVPFQSKTDLSVFNDTKYEAVSPAPSDNHQNAGSDQYNVSLQDLASISSTREKMTVSNAHQKPRQIIEAPRPVDKRGPVQMQQELYGRATPNGQITQIKQNPTQQQQQNIAGSPQTPMSLGSPPMPSSTFITAPVPVQAPADSTTKPKKARSRKKKEPVTLIETKKEPVTVYPENVQFNQQMINPAIRDQPFSSSSEVIQRTGGNEYVNQQTFMQNSRTSQSVDNIQQQNPQPKPTAPDINRSAQPLPQPQYKSEQSPIMAQPSPASVHQQSPMGAPQQSPMAAPQQSPLAGPQQSPMMARFQSPSPMPSQSGVQYSVSDALEMSREAMFAGYNGSEMNSYPLQETFASQLGIQRPDAFGANEGPFSSEYGGQFVSPNNVLAVEIQEAPDPASTIDEGAFASLMDESYDPSQSRYVKQEFGQDPYANFPLTVNPSDQDDEFGHLAQAPKENKNESSNFGRTSVKTEPIGKPQEIQQPPITPRMDIKSAAGGSSFMDSYLNFLQGKKPETLSSMSSAIIQNKPQLPKYIPEPRRPRPVEVPKETPKSDDGRTNSPKRDIVSKSSSKPSVITFSDDEEDQKSNSQISSAVNSAISNLSETKSNNVKISTNKSGGLKMKINLLQVKSAEAKAKAAKSKRSPNKSKRKGKRADSSGDEDYGGGKEEESPEPIPVPHRETSARKAKQKKGELKFLSAFSFILAFKFNMSCIMINLS